MGITHRIISLVGLVSLLIITGGCTQRIADLTVMSTRNVNIGEEYTKVGSCKGKDTKYIVLSIPLGTPNMESAAEDCLSSANGDLLTNVVIKSRVVNFVLGGSNSFIVEGNVFDQASTSQVRDPDTETFTLTKERDGLKLISNSTPDKSYSVKVSR